VPKRVFEGQTQWKNHRYEVEGKQKVRRGWLSLEQEQDEGGKQGDTKIEGGSVRFRQNQGAKYRRIPEESQSTRGNQGGPVPKISKRLLRDNGSQIISLGVNFSSVLKGSRLTLKRTRTLGGLEGVWAGPFRSAF